jgi:hypothetical protein
MVPLKYRTGLPHPFLKMGPYIYNNNLNFRKLSNVYISLLLLSLLIV